MSDKRAGCMWFQMDPNTKDKEVEELIKKFLNDNEKKIPGGYLYILESLEDAQFLIKRMEKALSLGKHLKFSTDGELIIPDEFKEELAKIEKEDKNQD